MDHYISLLPNFLTCNLGFHILGASVGSRSFVDSFVPKFDVEKIEGNEGLYFYLYPLKDLI